jgi:hypothetical protein
VLDRELLKSVAAQMMSGNAVVLSEVRLPVKRTGARRFRTVQFEIDGRRYQAIEQNRERPSRWGQLAREGHRVVQFRDLESNKYVAVAVDEEIMEYGKLGKK